MKKNTIQKEQYPLVAERFCELTFAIEKLYSNKLKEENISTPIAAHFIMGETLANTYSGSPSPTLPDWLKKLLLDSFNEALLQITAGS